MWYSRLYVRPLGVAVRSRPWNGDLGTAELLMSPLSLIRNRAVKAARLDAAQKLMAKAYRGVSYTELVHSARPSAELSYRGVFYQCQRP